jgi:hypothetical protein
MRAVLLLAVATHLLAAPDAREIIRRATEADRRNEEISRNYTFVERVSKRFLNGDGSVKRTEIRTYDITLSEGTPYVRLIGIDDKPLPPDRERKEQEKLQKSIEERQRESPQQRAKRVAQWEKDRRKDREFVDELLDAMDFKLTGEEEIAGRKAWVISATPRPGYRPKSMEAKFLVKMRGRTWIDEEDYMAARIEAEATGDISMGFFLAKVDKGSRFYIDQTRVNNEVWLPQRIEGRIAARLLIVRLREAFDMTFKDFRKFQVESRIVAGGEEQRR